jgi:tetratricopeptide (TPR) repeat protein
MIRGRLARFIIAFVLAIVLFVLLDLRGNWIARWQWWTFFAIVGFCYLTIWIHEFGHALAGMAVGFPIKRITIGMGRELTRKQIGNTLIVVNSGFGGGMTGVGQVSERWLKPRFFIFVLGGVLAQSLAIVAIMLYFDVRLRDLWAFREVPFAHIFIYCNVILILVNLFPFRINMLGVRVPNDGLRIWKLPFMEPREVQEILSMGKIMEALELYEAKQYRETEKAFRECVHIYPATLIPKINLSAALIKQLKLDEATTLLELQKDCHEDDPYVSLLYNNLAWAYLLKKDEDSLRLADHYSARAIELSPKQPNILCTRGCVLIEHGEFKDGIKLIRKLANLRQPFDDRINSPAAFIGLAYGYYQRGNQKKALQYVNKLEASFIHLDLDYQVLFELVVEKTDNFGRPLVSEIIDNSEAGLVPQAEELS